MTFDLIYVLDSEYKEEINVSHIQTELLRIILSLSVFFLFDFVIVTQLTDTDYLYCLKFQTLYLPQNNRMID